MLNNWDTGLLDEQSIDFYGEELRYTLPSDIVLCSMSGDQEINVYTNSTPTNDSINYGYTYATQTVHTYSEEIDAISPTTGAFSWITGAAWAFNREEFTEFAENYGPPYTPAAPDVTLWNREFLWIKTEGLFGQMTWNFTPTLETTHDYEFGWKGTLAGGHVLTQLGGYYTQSPPATTGSRTSAGPVGFPTRRTATAPTTTRT